MEDILQDEDYELYDMIINGLKIPMKKDKKGNIVRKEGLNSLPRTLVHLESVLCEV